MSIEIDPFCAKAYDKGTFLNLVISLFILINKLFPEFKIGTEDIKE